PEPPRTPPGGTGRGREAPPPPARPRNPFVLAGPDDPSLPQSRWFRLPLLLSALTPLSRLPDAACQEDPSQGHTARRRAGCAVRAGDAGRRGVVGQNRGPRCGEAGLFRLAPVRARTGSAAVPGGPPSGTGLSSPSYPVSGGCSSAAGVAAAGVGAWLPT